MLLKKWIAVLSLGLAATAAQAHSDAVLGGALGGAAGAVIGSSIGGRDGAIVGGALGAATGVAISQRPYYYEPAPVVYAPPRRVVVEDAGAGVSVLGEESKVTRIDDVTRSSLHHSDVPRRRHRVLPDRPHRRREVGVEHAGLGPERLVLGRAVLDELDLRVRDRVAEEQRGHHAVGAVLVHDARLDVFQIHRSILSQARPQRRHVRTRT